MYTTTAHITNRRGREVYTLHCHICAILYMVHNGVAALYTIHLMSIVLLNQTRPTLHLSVVYMQRH